MTASVLPGFPVFQTAGALVAGAGSFHTIAGQLHLTGGKPGRVLIVTSPSMVRQGFVQTLQKQLIEAGISSDLLSGIEPEPTAAQLEALHAKVERESYDLYIGLGGGSVLDAVKLLAVRRTNSQQIEDMLGVDRVERDGIPTVLIPTTSGTGSEVTPNAIVTLPERQLKIGVVSQRLYPKLAVLDPELTLGLPKDVTAATGMDAFTHALESFIGRKANPISDMFALESIRLISKGIVEAYENGTMLSAREAMLYGSTYGGMALAASGTAAVHALAYPLGGRFGIPHGVANAMLLPHVMESQLDAIRSRLLTVAQAIEQGLPAGLSRSSSGNGRDAGWVMEQIALWTKQLRIPQDLTGFGVTLADVPQLAEAASQVKRLMDNNPKPLTIQEIEQIYRKLLPI